MSDSSPALLDGARIRGLRHSAGLSTRALARQLGTSPTTVTHLEADTNHGELPLRLVADLAVALGVAPVELYAVATDQAPTPAPDDSVVEAALLVAGAATSTSAFADALGWTLTRVRDAIGVLAARQEHTGVRVRDHGWQRYALRPATEHLSPDQQHALHRLGPKQRGLTANTAALLHDVAEGHVTETVLRSATAAQQIALQSLLKQGLIVASPDGRFGLSDVARSGLYPTRNLRPTR